MKITLRFRDSDAKSITSYLRHRYNSKAGLEKLAMAAIRKEVAEEVRKELDVIWGKGDGAEVIK